MTAAAEPNPLGAGAPSRLPSTRFALVGGLLGLVFSAYVGVGLVLGLVALSPALRASAAVTNTVNVRIGGQEIALPALPILPPITLALGASESPLALFPAWKGTERVNVLLLGVDQRDDEYERGLPTRSDTLIVVSIDPVQKSAAMISFPRDLWVMIPGFGEERINVAYRTGELRRVDGGGAGLAARTVEHNFGLVVPYYATIDFRGFQEVVGTLGGLVIDVPRPLRDDEYPTDDYGLERIYFAPGPQIMDGPTALKYARTRHQDSDFSRMARQQQVLLGTRDRALRLNMLPRLPALLDQGTRAVQTNFSATELLGLARLMTEIESTGVGTLVIDNQLVTSSRGGASILFPKKNEIVSAIRRAQADPRLLREGGRVEVASTRGRAALAQQTADRLAGEGLQVSRASGALAAEPESTTVFIYSEKPRSLDALMRALGLTPDAVIMVDAEDGVDLRVVIGADFQLPV